MGRRGPGIGGIAASQATRPAKAARWIGQSHACPLDFEVLLPVPADLPRRMRGGRFDDDGDGADTPVVVWPRGPDLHSVLAGSAAPRPLGGLLPDPGHDTTAGAGQREISGWTSTFAASLELARQGAVTLARDGALAPILVSPAAAD